MSGARHRRKGDRVERELVQMHRAIGLHCERVPLSGASRYQGNGADIDIYAFGTDEAPLVAEVKARRDGAGFATLERWLGEYDALFLRRNNADPLVLVPWRMWARLLEQVRR
jgi:Holliday junction resolvase